MRHIGPAGTASTFLFRERVTVQMISCEEKINCFAVYINSRGLECFVDSLNRFALILPRLARNEPLNRKQIQLSK